MSPIGGQQLAPPSTLSRLRAAGASVADWGLASADAVDVRGGADALDGADAQGDRDCWDCQANS